MVTSTKSYMAKKESFEPEWYLVDAQNAVVGRLATQIATVLMGKHKPTYTPHVDTGDYVIVLNVDKVRFSGSQIAHESHPSFTTKMLKKEYQKYTGYPGGRRVRTGGQLLAQKPEMILEEAVRRMLPKSKLGRAMLKKLKLYVGTDHPHQAQQPKDLPEHLQAK